MNTFFELLRVAVGLKDSIESVPSSREEWEALYKVVGEHNLLGVTFPVIDELHDETEIPLGVYTRWAMVSQKIEKKNENHRILCRELYNRFTADGLRSCIFKGQAAALRYPRPELRQSGDIDIWIEGETKATVEYLKARYNVKKVFYHHCDTEIFEKKKGVEVHFTPTWMNSPFSNRKLQRYFVSISEEQFSNYCEELGCCIPTKRFDAVYMMLHMLRHVLDEGVGLRQLLDYYYLLINMTPQEKDQAIKDLQQLDILGFASGMMFVMQEVLGVGQSILLCSPDAKQGAFLLEEIMLSGNFGRFDKRNAHEKNESHIRHARRKLRRALRFLKYYPGEVLFMPAFMAWQYFWRRKNGYFYKGK